MAARSYMPETDRGLVVWSENFADRLLSSGGDLGISPAQAAQYAVLAAAFKSAMVDCDPGVRNQAAVSTKNAARDALKSQTRFLVYLLKGQTSLSEAQKSNLGLTVARPRSPIAAPGASPEIIVESVAGFTVKLKLRGDIAGRRGKPMGVEGAAVFSFLGDEAPSELSLWTYNGNTTHPRLTLDFPSDTAPGAKAWFMAYWYNPRQRGPASSPICTHIQGGGVAVKGMRAAA